MAPEAEPDQLKEEVVVVEAMKMTVPSTPLSAAATLRQSDAAPVLV